MGVLQRQAGLPGQSDFIPHLEGRRVRREARRVGQTEGIWYGSPRGKKVVYSENKELIAATREYCGWSSDIMQQRGS